MGWAKNIVVDKESFLLSCDLEPDFFGGNESSVVLASTSHPNAFFQEVEIDVDSSDVDAIRPWKDLEETCVLS